MNTLLTQDAVTPHGNSTREIPLTQGKVAIVDAADYEWLRQWKWCAKSSGGNWYAVRNQSIKLGRKIIRMHRVITSAPDYAEVDHIDGDGLNNRRSNLRLATHQQNICNARLSSRNTSGFKGVAWDKTKQMWAAHICANRKQKHVGYFGTKEAAAAAYVVAAKSLHGEFANPGLCQAQK